MSFLKSPYLPDPFLLAELVQRRCYARITAGEQAGMRPQWFLLCGLVTKEWLLNPQPAALRKLLPPDDRTWADPFLWKRGDDWFIFCEEWNPCQARGHIAVLRLSRDGQRVLGSEPVLVKDHHLSYPFLFEHDGALHMLPEAGHGRAVEVYRCEEFPARWQKVATLMPNIDYVDASLLEYQLKWWLFLTIKRGVFALNRDLFVFWADTPLTDKWIPLPGNPVVRGLRKARPAGRLFEVGGRIFRPSQNCLVRYGHKLNVNEVLQLDTRHYKERVAAEVNPDWEEGIRAVHHIDWRDGMVAMDAQRLLSAA